MIDELNDNVAATAQAHNRYLDLSRDMTRQYGETFELQNQLMEMLADMGMAPQPARRDAMGAATAPAEAVAFTREQCMEFAIGSVGKVLGPAFEVIDTYKARVRLPDTPLMLVDRILSVEGEKCSLGPGRLVTEHDVCPVPGTWTATARRCASRSKPGQADLFLSSYLGIDHEVKGERTYRLLDATIRFHRGLPRPGETIRYDIHIDKFVRQGATFLFFFRFEGYIGDSHLITMTDGCAGFFTEQEVKNSGASFCPPRTARPARDVAAAPTCRCCPWPTKHTRRRSRRCAQAMRPPVSGQLSRGYPAAGVAPAGRTHAPDRPHRRTAAPRRPLRVGIHQGRGGYPPRRLVSHLSFRRRSGDARHLDVRMLRAYAARAAAAPGMGHDQASVGYEPVPEVPCRLKCRGPVTPQTRRVHYAVEIKEIGYGPEPYVVADAHMYADGRYIVFFGDMSMQMSGVREAGHSDFWVRQAAQAPQLPIPGRHLGSRRCSRARTFCVCRGPPVQAFGEPYRVFDQERKIARLPGPPYCFMDRVTAIEPPAWVLKADGWVEAEYDVPADGWYFAADRSGVMPFCVLLEIALQPCGWLAAYAGSALKSKKDLKFRNLGGKARLHANIAPAAQTLIMRTRMTKVSEAADMIIENFDFEVLAADRRRFTPAAPISAFSPHLPWPSKKGCVKPCMRPGRTSWPGHWIGPCPPMAPSIRIRSVQARFFRQVGCACRPRLCACSTASI
jgi:3-hydroxymyristoyl/3-hydroxydecanoyl-(acyl carrier protein) dehydratase